MNLVELTPPELVVEKLYGGSAMAECSRKEQFRNASATMRYGAAAFACKLSSVRRDMTPTRQVMGTGHERTPVVVLARLRRCQILVHDHTAGDHAGPCRMVWAALAWRTA